MQFYYFTIFGATLILSIIFTMLMKRLAVNLNIIDRPDEERKIHRIAMPLLGGMAIFLSFFIILYFVRD